MIILGINGNRVTSTINTGFNMHEEPIVRTAEDARQAAELDALILGPFLVRATTA